MGWRAALPMDFEGDWKPRTPVACKKLFGYVFRMGWAAAILLTLLLPISAVAQSSADLVERDPHAAYLILKKAIQTKKSEYTSDINFSPGAEIDPIDCPVFIAGQEYSDELSQNLAQVASTVVMAERVFRHFPEHLWKPQLQRYEREEAVAQRDKKIEESEAYMTLLQQRTFENIAARLNNYRSSNRNLPKIVLPTQSSCEFAALHVNIVTIPQASRILLLNVLSYDLCREQGIDVFDWTKCKWVDYSLSSSYFSFGRYHVYALWADGTSDHRLLDTDSLGPGTLDKGKVFEIKKSR